MLSGTQCGGYFATDPAIEIASSDMALDAANQNWCIHLLFVDQEESQGVMRPIQILFVFAYLVVIKK